MTKEQIEKAAGEISDHPFIEIERQGFIRGANWRIKSVWHGPKEEPRHKELCLIELKSKTSLLAYSIHFKGEQPYFEACFISATYDMDDVIRYAYVKDLLPEE